MRARVGVGLFGLALATLATGCPTQMERRCRYDRESVTAADCFTAGLSEGYEAGLDLGELDGSVAASDECAAASEPETAAAYAADSGGEASEGCDCGGGGESGVSSTGSARRMAGSWASALAFLGPVVFVRRRRARQG